MVHVFKSVHVTIGEELEFKLIHVTIGDELEFKSVHVTIGEELEFKPEVVQQDISRRESLSQ